MKPIYTFILTLTFVHATWYCTSLSNYKKPYHEKYVFGWAKSDSEQRAKYFADLSCIEAIPLTKICNPAICIEATKPKKEIK